MYWDNGKDNGNYRDYRDYIRAIIRSQQHRANAKAPVAGKRANVTTRRVTVISFSTLL